jgi:hypothetical protein
MSDEELILIFGVDLAAYLKFLRENGDKKARSMAAAYLAEDVIASDTTPLAAA